jgi:hypothetical protein
MVQRQKLIETQAIRIVGEHGKNAAEIGASEDGWVSLTFKDLNGDLRLAAMMTPSGKPTLTLFDSHKARITLGVIDGDKSEEFSIRLSDTSGNRVWQVPSHNPY